MSDYLLISLSVLMFGTCFLFNDVYRKMRGSTLKISLQSSLFAAIGGLAVMIVINGLVFEKPTLFTLLMAFLSTLNGFLFTFCGFRALDTINLSLYSLFSMLGGMVLPFLQGIIFYNEPLTYDKIVCFALICVALLLTVERGNEKKKKARIYYIAIFLLNGMSGVLSKIFASAPFEKTSAASYSMYSAGMKIALALFFLWILHNKLPKVPPNTLKSVGIALGSGAVNRVANFWLILALANVDASVQYPMVTGGVMIVSTAVCYFRKDKPSRKEVLSVLIAFLGLLLLFLL